MSDQIREQLSALVDGELARDELRFLLRRIDSDVQLAHVWTRYQVAGTVLRRQTALLPLSKDFADVVSARLSSEGSVGGLRLGSRVLRWAGGGAIAAAVAVLALVSSRPSGHLPEAAATLAAAAPAAAAISTPSVRATAPAPMQPAFDFAQRAQPASFDTGVIPLPRYRREFGGAEAQEMLGPYVLLTTPQPPEPQSVQQH